jgi:LEA14-like dessication related protein
MHLKWKWFIFLGICCALTACKSTPPQDEAEPVPEITVPLRITEPEFTITSIKILQADLINTRMKLTLKIDNPNTFPISLSSFKYELYGDGNFWTGGIEKDLATIEAQSSSETDFNLEMNFINMKRRLLDDITAMRQVHYRIVGTMEVGADIPDIPAIHVKFDYSGDSEVKK